MKRRTYRKLPIKIVEMSVEQRREYQREATRRHRLLHGAGSPWRPDPQPERWTCKKCHTEKPFTAEFFYAHPKSKWGLMKQCKVCNGLKSREYIIENKYGISVDDYKKLTTGCCAICGTEGKLHLDHCHDSGNIRDGLCNGCNTGLGMFRDDPDRLRVAALYVERHRLLT
jgi:hypothetical protein